MAWIFSRPPLTALIVGGAIHLFSYVNASFVGHDYPQGLKGEQIPLSVRIVVLVDVHDALRQKRVYKPALSHEKALSIITVGGWRTDPAEFDPQVLAAFKAAEKEMAHIFDNFQNDAPILDHWGCHFFNYL